MRAKFPCSAESPQCQLHPPLRLGGQWLGPGWPGAIDAHHGSNIPSFISSLERIAASDIEWLLPSHGPVFRKNDELLEKTINRLKGYLTLADFGTCATRWPLMDEWDKELAEGRLPSEQTQTA